MRGAQVTFGLAMAAAMLVMAPAHAADVSPGNVDLSAYAGVWGDGRGYDCNGQPGTETMPLTIAKDENGAYGISAYEFSCSVLGLEQRKTTVAVETRCGHEGTDEESSGTIELGLTADGHLFFSDGGLTMLTRCPAAQ